MEEEKKTRKNPHDHVDAEVQQQQKQEEEQNWVLDSSLDHKARVPRRSSTGCWKAALFIVVIEFSERLSYFGLASSLIIYLTRVLHEDVKTAAKNVNYWGGVTAMMPLVGGFVADAFLGRFSTVVVSSLIYISGLIVLTMSQLVPSLKPCGDRNACDRSSSVHEIIFFLALYLISVGTGGHKPSLESFGADQFDDNHSEERKMKMSYFNWWNFALCSGVIIGCTVIVYVEDSFSWWPAYVLLTSVMCLSLLVFVAGRPLYRYRAPAGSPFTPMLRVVVAAFAKRRLRLPSDDGDLYEVPRAERPERRLLCHTSKLRFLDRAAIVDRHDAAAFAAEERDPWRLATVTQVEELKLILSMFPIWLTAIPFGICVAQSNTFFIKQASVMDRHMGGGGFKIPAASVFVLSAIGMIVSVTVYDKLLVPFLRRATGSERGISILKRIGIGMALSTVAMVAAATVERRRLRVVGAGSTTMSVFWLVPQFTILGVGDAFALVGLQEYFYDQVPDGMRSLGIALYLSVLGVASFTSSALITAVDHITAARRAKGSWFGKDLNGSRLDLFLWLVAGISAVNLAAYVYLARMYSYKRVQCKVGITNSPDPLDDAL